MNSPVAVLFATHRPGTSAASIADAADVPLHYLQAWLAPETAGRPAAPPARGTLVRIAAALGAELPAVDRAFTAAWSTLGGSCWNHFAAGDRVLVFGAPDPETGRSLVRRATVTATSGDRVGVDFDAGGDAEYTPADGVRLSHANGSCRNVVALP
ncbi:hypothetical protein [Amycolatopsis sp. NPDC098790]|uniref:hypothetical protein n=1 Tax=Amycolatopsis sp. NPDC098790 TaxID=3363939 RepID=UPI0037F92F83